MGYSSDRSKLSITLKDNIRNEAVRERMREKFHPNSKGNEMKIGKLCSKLCGKNGQQRMG
jgi:hypothetical protein